MLSAFSFSFQNQNYSFYPSQPIDISIPLKTGTDTVNCFWAEPVQIEPIRMGDFVGSVAEGGSVNYQRLAVTPHGNGTHTECYGHISTDKNATINKCLTQFLFFAKLVSLPLHKLQNGDEIVRLEDVKNALPEGKIPEALILRTLPNSEEKLSRQYSGTNPPYLEPGIGEFLAENNVRHLLLDLPSVDREMDEGKLENHHQFWQYPHNTRCGATITELIFVPEHVEDGNYLLNLQIASLEMDASPSKPVLYKLGRAN